MSDIFFEELNIPKPDYNLNIGSDSHGKQTGEMLSAIDELLLKEKPDYALVYGDTNSTLAGALAASKLHIPVAHVEAGLRSFNRKMPEEINRVLTDHISTLLFAPTETAVKNLSNEGITAGVHNVGDVMYDATLYNIEIAEQRSKILDILGIKPQNYCLATVHRAENTDNRQNLENILKAFKLSKKTIVFPLHPRTKNKIKEHNLEELLAGNIKVIEPVGYLDMLILEKYADKILTDSGGVQKEAYFMKIPCITMRTETEWVETVEAGWNIIVDTDIEKIVSLLNLFTRPGISPALYGDGNACFKIMQELS
jgi:UDP-N-acetylglucosamine 2-epimerase